MLISVFTPSHRIDRLPDLYKSLVAQTHTDWERVILLNNLSESDIRKVETTFINDSRVKIFKDDFKGEGATYVGRLKNLACQKCLGDWLLEVDHDDLLEPTALEEVANVPLEYDMCYSNTVNINWPAITPVTWWAYFWRTNRPFKFDWADVQEAVSASPSPQSISRIRFAPNHLRARRSDFYTSIGGHNASLKICDDHDLILRTYLKWKIYHIDKPLYIYRIRWDNTWQQNAAEIQTTMRDIYRKNIRDMMKKWSKENNLWVYDLGWAISCPEGYESIDRHNSSKNMNLNKKWKLKDNSVGILRCHDILEHLESSIHTFNEARRVLKHGWMMDILVPSDCWIFRDWKYYPPYGASCDSTHISRFNKRSFRYFCEPLMRKYNEPEAKMMFTEIMPAQEILMFDNIPYVSIHLMCWKPPGERYYWANNRRS